MGTLTRIYCRQNQFSLNAAEKLGVPVASVSGTQKAFTLTHELILEWDRPRVARTPVAGPAGQPIAYQVMRIGKIAWIRLIVNVYSDQHNLQWTMYTVALGASEQNLRAQHSFHFGGLPQNVSAVLPNPGDWAEFNQKAYEDAFAKIKMAQELLAKLSPDYEPPEVAFTVGVISLPEIQFVKSVKFAADCVAFSSAGRVRWDAEASAGHNGLDASVCEQVYDLFGCTSRYLLPGAAANKSASDWKRWIEG